MTNLNESNSVFTQLNPEDAASINGGYYMMKQGSTVFKRYYSSSGHLRWIANVSISNGNGTYNANDDFVSFNPDVRQPKLPNRARNQAVKFFDDSSKVDNVWYHIPGR